MKVHPAEMATLFESDSPAKGAPTEFQSARGPLRDLVLEAIGWADPRFLTARMVTDTGSTFAGSAIEMLSDELALPPHP